MATSVKFALTRFMATVDCLIHFEATVNAPGAPTPTLSASKIRRDHLNSLWQTVKAAYDICCDCIIAAGESAAILKSKYYKTYSTYEIFAAQLMEQIQKGSSQIPQAAVTPSQNFTSLRSPLTNDGFRSAWNNLTEIFENKRLQVNSYLKTLFNVQSIAQESGAALEELQRTFQGCLTFLKFSGVNIENWDPILVYMCSNRQNYQSSLSHYGSSPSKIKPKFLRGLSLIPI